MTEQIAVNREFDYFLGGLVGLTESGMERGKAPKIADFGAYNSSVTIALALLTRDRCGDYVCGLHEFHYWR